jgi:DNA polymerase-4
MPSPGRDRSLAPGTRRILHLDIDAFLASVEQALHPALRGRPVVVGGLPNERNLVMSCSYEARSFGVQPGQLLSEAARRCPRAIFRRGDSQAAGRMREQVAAILRRSTPRVEIASIDDFFADLTGTTRLLGAACSVAESIRASIARELALPVTIGIGTNKMIARLAGKLAKPGGIGEILPGCEERFLRLLPVEHLPGVGRSIGARLESYAIRTAGDLRCVSREVLFASFGRNGLVLHERARGIDEEPVCERPPRSIRRESTFEPEEGRRDLRPGARRAPPATLQAASRRARSPHPPRRYADERPAPPRPDRR